MWSLIAGSLITGDIMNGSLIVESLITEHITDVWVFLSTLITDVL